MGSSGVSAGVCRKGGARMVEPEARSTGRWLLGIKGHRPSGAHLEASREHHREHEPGARAHCDGQAGGGDEGVLRGAGQGEERGSSRSSGVMGVGGVMGNEGMTSL